MSDSLEELLSRMAVALGIGLLIGLERGWRAREGRPGSRTAGVRTFTITGLLGGIVGAIATHTGGGISAGGGILLGIAFAAYATVIALFSRDENRASNTFSATTAIAALLTFILGAYALVGDMRIAGAAAVVAAGVLIAREELHEWVKKITLAEFQSALLLLAMTFVVLPVIPDVAIERLGGVNPRQVWLIAIVLAAVSFAGYVAVKMFGERLGMLMAAAAGGMVSSTAVTLSNARRAAAREGSPGLLAAGALLATAVSYLRVAAIVAVLKPTLIVLVTPALVVGALVAAGFAIVRTMWRPSKQEQQAAVQFRNPFGLWSVIGLALLLGVLIVAGRWIYEAFGAAGAIAGAAAMGLFDVDAMVVSMTRLVPQSLDVKVGAYAILVGVASNSISKVAIGAVVGRGSFAVQVTLATAGCLLAGWLALLLTLAVTGH